MSAEERVPSELWLEILENLDENADRETLANFSVASPTFRSVALPFLFSKFRFTVYHTSLTGEIRFPSPTKIGQCLARLAFWSSPNIAPLVRLCRIGIAATWERRCGGAEDSAWTSSTDSPFALIDAVFQRLTQFTGLQQLQTRNIQFSVAQARVDNISRFLIIPFELGIYCCSFTFGEHTDPSSHATRVSDFTLRFSHRGDDGDDHWIPLLNPGHLHSLSPDLDLGRTDAIPSFPSAHSLTATLHPAPSQNWAILSKFPAVRALKIAGNTSDLSLGIYGQTPPPMLLLQQYIGPHQALSVLASAATLTRLSTSKCRHMDLITTLQEIGPNSIALFHMEFPQLDSAAFSTLVELLPHLTELVIHIVVNTTDPFFAQSGLANDQTLDDKVTDSIDCKVSTFFLELSNTPNLPPGLERLAISWECHCEDRHGQRKAEIPKFAQLRDTFVERTPRLVWVFFRGFYYQFEWQIAPDGMSKESIGVACLDSHKQRYGRGLESFWQR